ncbi:MAG: hypothetical protein H6R25_3306 [Proteobacteria bacterium]|nr:hypothetical protein [Pseudomonadota bacterium]
MANKIAYWDRLLTLRSVCLSFETNQDLSIFCFVQNNSKFIPNLTFRMINIRLRIILLPASGLHNDFVYTALSTNLPGKDYVAIFK